MNAKTQKDLDSIPASGMSPHMVNVLENPTRFDNAQWLSRANKEANEAVRSFRESMLWMGPDDEYYDEFRAAVARITSAPGFVPEEDNAE